MSGFLLDTNVISELVKQAPSKNVVAWMDGVDERTVYLSVLTIGEIRVGIARLRSGAKRARLESWLDVELKERFAGRIVPIDESIAERWGTLTAEASLRGQPVPVIDGLLAATALEYGLTFVTRNTSDVAGTGAVTLNPWL